MQLATRTRTWHEETRRWMLERAPPGAGAAGRLYWRVPTACAICCGRTEKVPPAIVGHRYAGDVRTHSPNFNPI
eukprot:scaffold2101_cov98-Isochrysis_galbana.AAC.4